ncbi:hypothetical protein [Dinghuibacter silviterrae]|uniref:Uncharacterized protein n=1 Tax=Dinghuibacter silviterrae TaxID=1539049 RepID=A0A4R8DHN7_9BACT|nr:hypothetical protein [Dinghuibacter silviterrae]TDW96764.1 hypothetical protein EDB95_4600 [Dinghuibacter silviterrae]
MKYSQSIGIVLVLAFGVVAFLPWIYIPSLHVFVKGMDAGGTLFGKPALFNIFCCGFALLFFAIPRLWAKRANIFFTTMNLAWALKNFIILSICREGECPERLPSLYLMFILALGILVMSFLPKLEIKKGTSEDVP